MKDGFVKCAAAGIKIRVADPAYNTNVIIDKMDECAENGAKVIVFPELAISGYTCGDLFLQEQLINGCKEGLREIIEHSRSVDAIVFVGLPFAFRGNLYNVAAVVSAGRLLGLVPKKNLPNYNEFYELRHFLPGQDQVVDITFDGKKIPFGSRQLFETESGLSIGCEICEDLWAPINPGTYHALAGANLLVNLSASNELVGKNEYRRRLVYSASARLMCGYVYASAGEGESTQDVVFGGHHLIAENGTILKESECFANETIYGEIDIKRIVAERRRNTSFVVDLDADYRRIPFALKREETQITRIFARMPFVPEDETERVKRCEEIFAIQANGLKKRLEHTNCSCAVIGVSGGLDSTLAMLVTVKAFDLLGIERKNIKAVTMPCFGTTDRTYENACLLAKTLGCSLQEVDIKKSVTQHFEDIGQDLNNHDVTFENGQARERTQVLMDIANQCNGMVIGTGDLSELALGWATYNGDHMSMYGVNGSIPKTLVRHLVRYYADHCCVGAAETGVLKGQISTNESSNLGGTGYKAETDAWTGQGCNKESGILSDQEVNGLKLQKVLLDVLDTPVSPELLPPVDGVISQKTEDLVGPYELHDFFLYYMLRCGFSPAKIYRIAKVSFAGEYKDETILKWLKKFYYRFFSQQFKRSCLPDGPKVGSVGVSPRGDLRMPSDASVSAWMTEIEALE